LKSKQSQPTAEVQSRLPASEQDLQHPNIMDCHKYITRLPNLWLPSDTYSFSKRAQRRSSQDVSDQRCWRAM